MAGAALDADLARRRPVAFAGGADVIAVAQLQAAVAGIAAAVAERIRPAILVALARGSATAPASRAELRPIVEGDPATAVGQAEIVTLRNASPGKHEVTRAADAFALLVAGCPVAALPLPFALFTRPAAPRGFRRGESESRTRCADGETGQRSHYLPA